MKWRLLEGGGQAYYELGVADSGALIGLPRAELEQSLETLEMMAGEIGASVIVVKEVEVPAAMAGLAGSETDYWNGKRRRRTSAVQSDASEGDSNASTTEYETELSTVEVAGFDDDHTGQCRSSDTSPNSSPGPAPSLSSFSTEPELDTGQTDKCTSVGASPPTFSVDLEIASVFKPLPMRNHSQANSTVSGRSSQFKSNDRTHLAKQKHQRNFLHPFTTDSNILRSSPTSDELLQIQTKQQAKALHRRQARDRKREGKRNATSAPSETAPVSHRVCPSHEGNILPPSTTIPDGKADRASADLASELAALHVSVEPPNACRSAEPIPIPDLQLESDPDADDIDVLSFGKPRSNAPSSASMAHGTSSFLGEPRLIVEALVVRKMSLEEAFLDFGGFSLP